MHLRLTLLLSVALLFSFFGNAQETVRGEVKDKKTGEGLYNVTIKVDGVGKARTDFEGFFTLKLAAGTYKITASNELEGYIDEDASVEVIAGNVSNLVIEIGKDKTVLEIAGVTVKAVRTVGSPTTLEGSDKRRMEESAASDELPKETITNSGVTNAADAVQMVPAASLEDGKNVYIRGLGDRYTKTILNNMEIPGLDPDRNSVQMDIFPAIMIDNITVYKTFTPNLNGDFTGGLVNIQTKDFPGRKTIYATGGFGYNINATFNPDFLRYDGGALDFLGFDDGTRKLPINAKAVIPHPAAGLEDTETFTKAFGKTMAAETGSEFLNQSYAISIGDQINKPIKKDSANMVSYGYNALLNYRTNNVFYKDVEYSEYRRDPDSTEYELFKDRRSLGQMGQRDVMWTAMLGQSLKFNRNKISLVVFHTQNGVSQAAELEEIDYDGNPATLVKTGLQYTQRSISNLNLSGLHFLDTNNRWKLNWTVTPTYSRILDPDIRSTTLEIPDFADPANPVYSWDESVGADVRRIFRDLNEFNVSGRFDLEYKYKKKKDSLESNFAFGGSSTYKNRSFDVSEYIFRIDNMSSNLIPGGDPNWFFEDENLWTLDKDSGVYAVGQQELANIYDANQLISGVYVMHEYPFSEKFIATYGVRTEYNVNRYTGENSTGTIKYTNEKVLEKLNVLPSLNVIYKIRKAADTVNLERSANIRAAYSQTVARPSFREISISQIYDPIQGRRYSGNIDLEQTLIHNADLRYEYFFGRTELISASAFYKHFINPIEVVANVAAPNEFKSVNAGVADVYGAEFEVRKALFYNEEKASSLVAGANFTYVVSRIDMRNVKTIIGSDTLTELAVRLDNTRDMEEYNELQNKPYRQMYGQSPWIINAFVTYKNDSIGLMVNLTYNVQGKKLAVIGVGSLPDVFEQPFHSLNFKISKTFGKTHEGEAEPRWSASFRAQNLLNMVGDIGVKRKYYEAFKATPQIFEYLNPGMTFSATVSYTLR